MQKSCPSKLTPICIVSSMIVKLVLYFKDIGTVKTCNQDT